MAETNPLPCYNKQQGDAWALSLTVHLAHVESPERVWVTDCPDQVGECLWGIVLIMLTEVGKPSPVWLHHPLLSCWGIYYSNRLKTRAVSKTRPPLALHA